MKKAFSEKTEKGYFDVKFYVVSESDFYFELLVQIFFTTAIFPENEPKIFTFFHNFCKNENFKLLIFSGNN
jgi:hypothetical protein